MTSRPLAVVTGAAHRLGRALAAAVARQGYAVGVHFHTSTSDAEATAAELASLGVPSFILQGDLRDPDAIESMFKEIERMPYPLRVLVNSAAVLRGGSVDRTTLEDWNSTFDLNLRAPFLCSQRAAKLMHSGGLIANITDVGARKSWSGFAAYAVSKAGLEALTRIMARAYAPSIRVNAISPGLVLRSPDMPENEWNHLVERLPLRRAAHLDEIADALEFLLKNDYVTGQTLTIDGGYSLLG